MAAIRRSKVKKKAMKDATRRLKVDKAYEFMKDCEFAMNAVMAAMKAVECASGVCNCFLRIWRGHLLICSSYH